MKHKIKYLQTFTIFFNYNLFLKNNTTKKNFKKVFFEYRKLIDICFIIFISGKI